jgi:DNA-directed RNA polymerase subunit RPC12/RpoP
VGARQEFECTGCGATAVVSGGPDGGSFSQTMTVGCWTCGQLDDITVAQFGETVLHDGDPMPPCRACGADAVAEWSNGNPCPKCGGPVEGTGRKSMLWD